MQHEAMITSLKSIKLYGMAQAVDELARQGSSIRRISARSSGETGCGW